MLTRSKRLLLLAAIVAVMSQRGDAMTRTFFPGASYPDAWPTGERCLLYAGSHVSTPLGDVAFPPGEGFGLMFLHCTPVGGFRFSGLAHDAVNLRYEWTAAGYRAIPGVTSGRTVYDLAGGIRDELPAGYQYVDETTGTPVSRLVTYGPTNGLSEWSRVADLAIGQGHDDGGVLVWDGTRLRVLTGPEYDVFVNVHRIGANVTISYATLTGAWIIQATLDELRALPVLSRPPPVPVPVPVPAPVPTPTPPPVADRLPDNVRAIRDAFVARFPIPQMAGAGPSDDAFENLCRSWVLQLAEQVVFGTGDGTWGVKNAGGGRPQSKDSLAHLVGGRLINFDLLSGVGTGRPSLVGDPGGEDITGQTFMPVSAVNHLGTTPPPPPPPVVTPPPATGPDLTPRVAALEQRIAALEQLLRESDDRLNARIDAIHPLDLAGLGAAIDAALLNYEVNGKTQRDAIGLQHVVKLGISKRQQP